MQNHLNRTHWLSQLARIFFLLILSQQSSLATGSPLSIKSAAYNKKTNTLVVKTSIKSTVSGDLLLLHGEGGVLSQAPAIKNQTFNIPKTQFGQVPCSVEARLGNVSVSKAVIGASLECKRAPTCKITALAPGLSSLTVNTDVTFSAQAKIKDKKAEPLTYEWDFAGGVMGEDITGTGLSATYKHPVSPTTTVKFVRDNSMYRVRFAATDSQKRRCEAAVEVKVGNPPTDLPPKVTEAAAPIRGNAMPDQQSLVVIPFQEWTMQHFTDMRVLPNGYPSFAPLMNNLNAYVFEKGSVGDNKPKFVHSDSISLQYSAASNPVDPAGANSINSTSQNWPLNSDISKPASLMTSTVQKADMWETDFRKPEEDLWVRYVSQPWLEFTAGDTWFAALPGLPKPDEGYFPHVTKDCSVWGTVEEWALYSETTAEDLLSS